MSNTSQSKRSAQKLRARLSARLAERLAAMPEHTRKRIVALRIARDEAMRKARNSAYYATATDISQRARQMWQDGACELVREARELNKQVRLVK